MPKFSPLRRTRPGAWFRLEQLEARDVPATGTIQGTLWNDLNGNGLRDLGEPGLGGRTVFLDANGNGTLDGGEATATTGADGGYAFPALPAGNYSVAQVEPAGWVQTGPGAARATNAAAPAVWQSLGPEGGDVQKVAFSPTAPGVALAAVDDQTYHGGLYRSADGGRSWMRLPAFDKDAGVLTTAFAKDGTAYAGTYGGLYKSADGGLTWAPLDVDSGNAIIVSAVAISPTDPNTVLVGQGSFSAASTLFRSTDGGATWQDVSPLGPRVPQVKAIAFDPNDPAKVYAGYGNALSGGGEVWSSSDGGLSWVNRSTATSGLPNAPINDFAFDPSGAVLAAGGSLFGPYNMGVYRSADGGATWASLSGSWPTLQAESVAVSGTTVAVGTERDGVYLSADGGATWSFAAGGTAGRQVNAVRFGPAGAPGLFAGVSAFGVLRSDDGGANFSPSTAGVQDFAAAAVAVNPLNPDELAVANSNLNLSAVLTSTDGGRTWATSALPTAAWKTVAFAPDGTLYAVGNGTSQSLPEGLYRRGADGTWTAIGPNVGPYYENDIQVVGFDPADPNVIFAAGETNYDVDPSVRNRAVVWKTADGGASWARVYLGADNVSVRALRVLGSGPAAVVLAGLYDGNTGSPVNGGVLRSADGGATWAISNGGLPASVEVSAISASSQDPNRVFLASSSYYGGYGVFVSSDAGQTWSLANGSSATDVLVDPANDQIVYAAGPGGKIGRSTDGGLTWAAFDGGLDGASSFYSDFHMAFGGGPVPHLFLNTWEGVFGTGLYSTAPATVPVALADGESRSGVDFGSLVLPGQISGTVWEDANGNGVQDGEFGRQGWVVYLDANNNGTLDPGEQAVRSVAGGGYRMTGVAPGSYTLRVQVQPHYHQTYPADGSYAVTVAPGGSISGENFGIQSDPTELHGTLWSDDNGNGVRDAGEAPLAGWTVFLDNNGNGKDDGDPAVTTDADGNYAFTNVTPGTYMVGEVRPPFYRQTTPGDGKSVYDAGLGFGPLAGSPTWADHDASTPGVIDVWYDFRAYHGYANQITDAQKAAAQAAMAEWERESGGRIKFTQNATAPDSDVIIIGTGDLAAVGYASGLGGVLGAGGAGGNPLADGVAWMDYKDSWDATVGNGDPSGGYDYFTVAGHEIGHALGLGHAENLPYQWHVDMAPAYGGELTQWSAVDRDGVRALYGVSDPNGLGFYVARLARGDVRTGLDFGNEPLPIPYHDLALDFGPAGQAVAAGYAAASSATVYDSVNGGYGWTRGLVTDVDRGAAAGTTDLTRDFASTNNAGFAVDAPDGTYDVTLTFGDASQPCDDVNLYLEHNFVGSVNTAAGKFVTQTYRVTISDRQLLIEMADFGGVTPQISLDALKVTRVMPSLTLGVSPGTFSEAAGANAATGTVTRGGDLSQSLTVALASSDTTEATVPATVTIAAGQASATFAVSAVDDVVLDGTQSVTLTAAAGGYNPASAQVSVTDNESPPPPPPPPPPPRPAPPRSA
jgi:photosystem II stability/assembly factor-like uncharacterized protein